MKALLLALLVSSCLNAAPPVTTTNKITSVNHPKAAMDDKKPAEPNALDKKTEDCDDKAKKPVEITPESISLSGNTGCSLDEAKP